MRLFSGLLATTALTLSLSANAQVSWYNDIRNATGYIDAEGREWLPVTAAVTPSIPLGTEIPDIVMSEQCNALTGWCGDQWDSLHWASMDEVAQLITEVTGQPLMPLSTDGAGALALELGVGYTWADSFTSYYTAFTRDQYLVNVEVKTDYRTPLHDVTGAGSYQVFTCGSGPGGWGSCNEDELTAWAWVAVPEPSTLGVMGVGVAAVLLMRRRKTARLQAG